MQQQLFADWSGDRLERVLTDAHIAIDYSRYTDIAYLRDMVSKNFVDAHHVADNAKQINMNIGAVHEQHIDNVTTLSTIIHSLIRTVHTLNNEVATHAKAMQMTDNVRIHQEKKLAALLEELQGHDCSLMLIGDAGAGKSTTINAIVQKTVVPTGIFRTTGAFLELRHGKFGRFSILESDAIAEFVEQPINFDLFPDTPSDALESFIDSDPRHRSFVRGRLEYPLPILTSGIVIHGSPGLNDTDQLTEAVTQDMMTCTALICVLDQGLTSETRQMLLQLIQLGREPDSIFFVITHVDGYSTEEKAETIDRLRSQLHEINPRFDHAECVILNPRCALDIFIKYNLHTKDYFEFLLRFTPFLNRILSCKYDLIIARLGETLRRLCTFIETMHYRAESIIKACEKQEATRNGRRDRFSNSRERLKKRLHDVTMRFLKQASRQIVGKLQSSEFKSQFEKAIIDIPFTMNIGAQLVSMELLSKETLVKELDLYKMYLQKKFETCTQNILEPLLNELTLSAIRDLWQMFCDDVCLAHDERNSFLQQLQDLTRETIFRYHRHILHYLLRSIRRQTTNFAEVFLSYYLIGTPLIFSSIFDVLSRNNAETLSKESRWYEFRRKLAQEFCAALVKLGDPNLINSNHHSFSSLLERTGENLTIIERLYLGTQHQMDENLNRQKQAVDLLVMCNHYSDSIIPPFRTALNKVQVSRLDCWSLSADMISFTDGNDHPSNDHTSHSVAALLKRTPTCQPITVHVRRLSGDFCALHVCDQTRSGNLLVHDNILHCYGAYCKENYIYVVTEPWQFSLRTLLTDVPGFSMEQRLKLAIELTEVCFHATSLLSIDHLTPDTLFITQDYHIKVNLVTHKPLPKLDNKHDDSELKRELQISHALGVIFKHLFTQDQGISQTAQSLCLLAKQCCKGVENNNYRPPTIEWILRTLKIEQVKLQFIHLPPNDLMRTPRKRCGLLAIDGGGARGIIAAKILERLQAVIGKPLWEVFNFGAGVSTGGLLIMSTLVRRTPPSELEAIYRDLAAKIFPPRFVPTRAYPVKHLEHVLKQHYGEIRMNRQHRDDPNVFVVTKRNYEPAPYLLRNYEVPDNMATFKGESGWLCSEAARATSAAPTFFEPLVRDGIQYSDGAMGFNNPVLLLFKEVLFLSSTSDSNDQDEKHLIPTIDYIVSIGTGEMDGLPAPVGPPKTGIARIFETVQLAVNWLTDYKNAHYQMQMLATTCGNIPYFRFNPRLPERVPLDIRSEDELNNLVKLTEAYLSNNDMKIPQQIQYLADLAHGS